MRRTKLVNKQAFKHAAGQCRICKEPGYEVLNVHRILPGAEGGKYTEGNSACVCANCHNKIHANQIVIDRYYYSTAGWLLRIIDENGEERFV
jgi:hypothetical protein